MKASCVLAAATAFFMASTEAFVPVTPGEAYTWYKAGVFRLLLFHPGHENA